MEATAAPAKFTIKPAATPSDLEAIRTLFSAYALSLGISLSFQDFSTELASLPGKYASPDGALLLAISKDQDQKAIGCVALRPLPNANGNAQKICEMKRLYTVPGARGLGVGNALADAVLESAKTLGYDEIRLDTLPSMQGAQKMYKKRGFEEIEAYYDTPLEGTIFLAKNLHN